MLFLSFHFLSDCMMLMLMRLNDGCLLCTSILHPWVFYFFFAPDVQRQTYFLRYGNIFSWKETELICSHHLSLWIFVFGSILVFLARGYKCRSSTHTHCNSHLFISVHLFVSNGDECCETPHKMSHSWNAQRKWWWNVTIYIH